MSSHVFMCNIFIDYVVFNSYTEIHDDSRMFFNVLNGRLV